MAEPTSNPFLNLGLQAAEVLRQRLSQPPSEPVVPVEITVEEPESPELTAVHGDELQVRLSGIASRLRQLEDVLLP
jgi:hypothetical protein